MEQRIRKSLKELSAQAWAYENRFKISLRVKCTVGGTPFPKKIVSRDHQKLLLAVLGPFDQRLDHERIGKLVLLVLCRSERGRPREVLLETGPASCSRVPMISAFAREGIECIGKGLDDGCGVEVVERNFDASGFQDTRLLTKRSVRLDLTIDRFSDSSSHLRNGYVRKNQAEPACLAMLVKGRERRRGEVEARRFKRLSIEKDSFNHSARWHDERYFDDQMDGLKGDLTWFPRYQAYLREHPLPTQIV